MGAFLFKTVGGLLARNLPAVFIAVLAAIVWRQHLALQTQAGTLGQTRQELAALSEDNQTLTGVINGYGQQLARLAGAQTEIRGALTARTREIGALQRENQQFRDWADTRLPAAVIGLRERPAATGTQAYREYLRARDAVHALSQPSADPR